LFDQYNFVAAMEHHTHFRKFTQKIKNNSISQDGMRFIGDGSWGVLEEVCQASHITKKP
jgi:hypothetical protein